MPKSGGSDEAVFGQATRVTETTWWVPPWMAVMGQEAGIRGLVLQPLTASDGVELVHTLLDNQGMGWVPCFLL